MRKLLCKLGWHNWGKVIPSTYRSPMEKRLAMPSKEAERTCVCCKETQRRDEHCLGLNPPAYSYTWYSVRK